MSMWKRDVLGTVLVCFAVGGFVLFQTVQYPQARGHGFGQGPAFYPQLLAISIIFLGFLYLFLNFKKRFRVDQNEQEDIQEAKRHYLPVVLLILLSVLLISFLEYLGFWIAGFLLTFLTALIVRGKVYWKNLLADLLFSIGVMGLVYGIFVVFVGIKLPGSEWFH